jgi:hypothetical protein
VADAPVRQTEKVVSAVELMYSNISRRNDNFGKVALAALGPGQWHGEREVFLRTVSDEAAFAEGE